MTWRKWAVIFTVVAALLTVGCEATGSPKPGAPKPPEGMVWNCSITSKRPSKVGNMVTASATARCLRAPKTHVIHLSIWRDTTGKGNWVQEKGIDNTWNAECHEIPTPGHEVTCPHKTQPWWIYCYPGKFKYRTQVLVTGSGHDGKDIAKESEKRPISEIKC